ncbi:thermostable hemolysin [Psychromonas ossibalaenae]|uniref:thermostable hemolysin n=1 Tax=Psychromonas ossibalaenae TaxID=444922 RepID=UPI0003707DCA|nr:thermostable hemolysin [Psychromonas ossibalaenae]
MKRESRIKLKVINAEHSLRAEVVLYDEQHQLLSVCGYRAAGDEPLFLEQYLDCRVEEILTAQFNTPVYRFN